MTVTSTVQLTEEQMIQFDELGYVHVRSVVPAATCRAAEQAIWDFIPHQPDSPATWPEGFFQPLECWKLPQVKACYTDDLAAIVDQIIGPDLHDKTQREDCSFGPIIMFPRRDKSNWPVPTPHIDQHGPMHRTFVLATIVYLHDVPSKAGATCVWPGEHRRLEDMALQSCELPAELLNHKKTFKPQTPPLEVPGTIGDVIFYARNTLHSGSTNLSDRPRVALQTMVHLNAAGEWHCRTGQKPRTLIERNYDRHFERYHLFNYFACQAKNQGEA